MYALARLQDKPGNWCWRVNFRRRGEFHYKSFYDRKLGGAEQALAAALAWRDARLAQTSTLSKREFHQLSRSTNSSGVPGVQFIRPKNQPLGSWQARLKLPNGKELTRTFAVLKYGDKGAFALAVAARTDFLGLVEDAPFLHSPAAREFAARHKTGKAKGTT